LEAVIYQPDVGGQNKPRLDEAGGKIGNGFVILVKYTTALTRIDLPPLH
jgi:hypothetical protein